jgi:acetyl esterase/lipase
VASIQTALLEGLVRALGMQRRLQRMVDAADDRAELVRLVHEQRRWDQPKPPRNVTRAWSHEVLRVDGFDLHRLTRRQRRSRRVILYLHGGGYMFGPFRTEWAIMNKIASAAGCDFAVLDYPKAPEHHAPQTVAVAAQAYEMLAATYGSENMILVGSSAGGALAVVIMAELRDQGRAQPSLAVLMSPGVDLTLSDDLGSLENHDVLLTAAFVRTFGTIYASPLQPQHPHVSPTFGELGELAPLHIFAGTREILLPSIERFTERATDSGTEAHLILGRDQQHTWPTVPTPEGRRAVQQIIGMIPGE